LVPMDTKLTSPSVTMLSLRMHARGTDARIHEKTSVIDRKEIQLVIDSSAHRMQQIYMVRDVATLPMK
jgi:hypothetical protein